MDPIMAVLFLYGCFHAAKHGVNFTRATSRAYRSGRSQPASGGHPVRDWLSGNGHAGAGWWASEIGHGFPTVRDGLHQGWTDHTVAATRRLAGRADRERTHTTIAEERRQHKAAIAQARAEREQAAAPTTQHPPSTPVMAPPSTTQPAGNSPAPSTPAGGSAPSGPPAGHQHRCPGCGLAPHQPDESCDGTPSITANGSGDQHMAAPGEKCTNPSCSCHTDSTAPASSNGSGGPTMSGEGTMAGDITYEGTLTTCDEVRNAIEASVSDAGLAAAEKLADGLGPMLPGDADTLGVAGDLASAIQELRASATRAMEACDNLKSKVTEKHGAANEAAQSTGVLAEQAYHEVSG